MPAELEVACESPSGQEAKKLPLDRVLSNSLQWPYIYSHVFSSLLPTRFSALSIPVVLDIHFIRE